MTQLSTTAESVRTALKADPVLDNWSYDLQLCPNVLTNKDLPDPAKMHELFRDLILTMAHQNLSLCSCESLTAGMFCADAASIPGAGDVLKGGVVTYWTDMKHILAKIPAELTDTYGVVSAQCAAAMAANTRIIMECDVCVSFTGNAGPDTLENKPAGMVYCAAAFEDCIKIWQFDLDLERNAMRKALCLKMAQLVLEELRS